MERYASRVLEGRYGRIELHNTSRTLDRVLLRPLSALERDTAVQGSELERALLLLSDIPGLQAKGTLLPGQAQGTTDLRVEARPGPLVGGRLEADNYGGRYMGNIAWEPPSTSTARCDWATRRD